MRLAAILVAWILLLPALVGCNGGAYPEPKPEQPALPPIVAWPGPDAEKR